MATKISRWHPLTEIEDLRRRFGHAVEPGNAGDTGQWSLAIDLIERDGRYVLRADVPGIDPDKVKIEVDDRVLTVSAEHERTEEEKNEHYVRRERHYGSFSRSLTLPRGVTADDVEASCRDGVVEVAFPKAKEEAGEPVTIKPTTG